MKSWFLGLSERERWMVAAAAALVFLAVLQLAIIAPLWGGTARLNDELVEREQLLAELYTAERAQARRGGRGDAPVAGADDSLVVIVDRSSRAAGLGPHLRGTQPTGDDALRVRFEQVAFERLVPWLADLQARFAIEVETATFDQGNAPGLVNASLVVQRNR